MFCECKNKKRIWDFFKLLRKNNVVFCSGKKVITCFRKSWLDTGLAFYFDNDKFNHLAYASIGYGEKCGYIKKSFKDIFIKNLDIE